MAINAAPRQPTQSPKAARPISTIAAGGLSFITTELRALAVPIDSVRQDPNNLRIHDARNLAAIENSLTRFGQYEPIVARLKDRTIIAGNARYSIATKLKWSHVAVVFLDEDKERAFNIAVVDNRSGDLSFFDPVALRAQALAIKAAGIDLSFFGFSPKALDSSWSASTVDPATISPYDPNDERAILKVEGVPVAIAASLVTSINKELAAAGLDLRAVTT